VSDLRKHLLEVYAKGPVESVHASAAYSRLCQEYEHDPAFGAERDLIEELRVQVDKSIGVRADDREQVEFALRLLWRNRKPERRQAACRELIQLTYGRNWKAAQRSYFDEKSRFVAEARDYFLSFTNRNPGKPNLNLVNDYHKHFIIAALGRKIYNRADLIARNLVAEAVHSILKSRQREGFYYPEHQGNNTEVEKKLRDECGRAFAFIQLVQGAMFRFDEKSRNWCHFEYNVARAASADRILFVKIDERMQAQDVSGQFDAWFQDVEKGDPVMLAETKSFNFPLIQENLQRIRDELTLQIDRRMDRVYMGIPK
jgi:hypothetical protein